MSVLLMSCNACGDVEVSVRDAKLIQIYCDIRTSRYSRAHDTWVLTCPCPGCKTTEHPVQLDQQIKSKLAVDLIQNGIEVVRYNPNINGHVPKKDSWFNRLFDSPKRVSKLLDRTEAQMKAFLRNEPLLEESVGFEIDSMKSNMDPSVIAKLVERRRCPNIPDENHGTSTRLFSTKRNLESIYRGLDFTVNPN